MEEEERAQERGGELALPGAQADPCCMGTQALEQLEVLRGFLEEEAEDRHTYLCLAHCVRQERLRRVFRRLAEEELRHAQKLTAAIYLLTGTRCSPPMCSGAVRYDGCCAVLRQRYHEESCGGFNYERAAQETLDPCLRELLTGFSADEYRHARMMLELLAGQM